MKNLGALGAVLLAIGVGCRLDPNCPLWAATCICSGAGMIGFVIGAIAERKL